MKMMNQLDYKKNSFDYIRLYAAIQVLIGHYYIYYRKEPSQIPFLFSGFLGLVILFALSGFLACASMEYSLGTVQYLKKRFARILPPYYVCILLNTIVILLIYPARPSLKDICIWLFTTVFAFHVTPDFLEYYATGSTNGSLWSIFVILQFYIIVSAIYPIIQKWKQWIYLLMIAIFIVVNFVCGYLCNYVLSDVASELLRRTCLPYLYIFMIGMYVYTFRYTIIPLLTKFWYIPLGLFLVSRTLTIQRWFPVWCYCGPIEGVLLPVITFALGYKLGNHRIKYDLSYGIFLYHFAIMNILIFFEVPSDSIVGLFLMILFSIIMSLLSLLLIEKPIGKKF